MSDPYFIKEDGTPRTAAERAAYRAQIEAQQYTQHSMSDDQSAGKIRLAAIEARRMSDKHRQNYGNVMDEKQQRHQARLDAQANEFEARVAEVGKQETAQQDITEGDEYKNAREHCESFLRTNPNPDRAHTAKAILDAFDVTGYWSEVRAIEAEEWAKLDAKRSDAELSKLAADRDHANLELAVTSQEARLREIP